MSRPAAASRSTRADPGVVSRFAVAPQHLDAFAVTRRGGLPIGTTRLGRPASIALFRPEPTRIVVVEQAWVASVLALRAAVLGAQVIVATDRPGPRQSLVAAVGGARPFANVVRSDHYAAPTPTLVQPALTLLDTSRGAPEANLASIGWLTSLHLVVRVGAGLEPLLDAADLVLVPRTAAADVDATVGLLRLPPVLGPRVQALGPFEFLAVSRTRAQVVTIDPTPTERALNALPR
jgi:hypothetical protein